MKNEFTFDVTFVNDFCWLERIFGVKVDTARNESGQRTRALRETAQRVSIDNILCDFLFFRSLRKYFHKTGQTSRAPLELRINSKQKLAMDPVRKMEIPSVLP